MPDEVRMNRPAENKAENRQSAFAFRRQTVVLIGLLVVVMLAAVTLGLLDALELDAVNLAFQLRGRQNPASPIVIVAIDDNTFDNTGLQWPWPRTYFAQLVDRLAAGGAKVVAFDVFFTDPEDLGKPATYTVRGETLSDIAKKYGVTAQAIVEANDLPANQGVCPGDELAIPASPAQTHVVSGDRLEDIAARFRVTNLAVLQRINGLKHPCDIHLTSAFLLRIPVAEGSLIYTVQSGDTVAGIAEAYQVNPLAVVVAEGVPAADPLTLGQTLTVQFGDAAFAASIQAAGNVVLNGQKVETKTAGYTVETLDQPITVLKDAAAGFGLTNVRPDSDGAVHEVQAWNKVSGEDYYSWPMVAASLYSGLPLGANPSPGSFRLGDRTVPLNGNNLRVNYLGPEGAIPTYSALQVVNGDLPLETFKDKIVFVGATTETLHDTYPTPFSFINATPGVEIMGNALETLLSGRYLRRAPLLVSLIAVLTGGLIALAVTLIRRTGLAVTLLFGLLAAGVVIWLAAFLLFRVEIPLLAPEITLFMCVVISFLERAISEELEKRRVRGIFELFISPEMVGQLIEQGIDAMRGKRVELTILFSDIRGFTTMSEKMTPEELVNLLNEYLGAMTEVIHRHGGTVDKYEGDLVMAFFGAPIPHDDHAERAVRCSIDMRVELDRLRAKWATEGKPSKLEMGIGLNTAEVFVGLVGSGRRVNYTVMGDGVNLASRVQDLTKDLKWPLLITEFTYERVKDKFDIEFGEAKLVKGKTVPVGMYKVVGEKGAPEERRVRPLFA
jgi:adenylate cyclase